MPDSGLIRWCEDDDETFTSMVRSTVEEFADLADYVARFGPFVDRIGWPDGKYFFCLPAEGEPESFDRRSLEVHAVRDPYYQYKIMRLVEGVKIRTGITAPWFGFPGGAKMVQFVWGDTVLTADECIELGLLGEKGR